MPHLVKRTFYLPLLRVPNVGARADFRINRDISCCGASVAIGTRRMHKYTAPSPLSGGKAAIVQPSLDIGFDPPKTFRLFEARLGARRHAACRGNQ